MIFNFNTFLFNINNKSLSIIIISMVWNSYLNKIKQECLDAAIIGKESGLSFTTSNQGIKLDGYQCIKVIQQINKFDNSINKLNFEGISELKIWINSNEYLYTFSKYSKDDSLIYYEDLKDSLNNSTYLIMFSTKMLVVLALIQKNNLNKSLFCITNVKNELLYKGL